MTSEPKRAAIFLDRDGVINRDHPDYVKSWDEFEFLPGSLEALAALSQSSYAIIVATNQSGVGRGLLTEATLQDMHARMLDRVRASGGRIDAIYHCPHTPSEHCNCRKPSPGLFLDAARELGIDLAKSWAIGDSYRDAEAANTLGIRSILVKRVIPDNSAKLANLRSIQVEDLHEAVDVILRG